MDYTVHFDLTYAKSLNGKFQSSDRATSQLDKTETEPRFLKEFRSFKSTVFKFKDFSLDILSAIRLSQFETLGT